MHIFKHLTAASYTLLAVVSTTVATKPSKPFDTVDMLSAPRLQRPIVSPNGEQAVSVVDQWDPKSDKTQRTLYLVSINETSQLSILLTASPSTLSEPFWLDNDTVAYLNGTSLLATSITSPSPSHILSFPAGVNPSGLKYAAGTLVFSGAVWSDGDFETVGKWEEEWENRGTTGVVFDELFVRHWDTWRVPGRVQTIGTVDLKKKKFINILNGTGLYDQLDPIEFAISSEHIAISLKSPLTNPAMHTRKDVYLFPLSGARAHWLTQLTPGAHGALGGLTFSPDGERLAWLQMAKDGYESDRRVVVVYDIKAGHSERWTDSWDRSPAEITFAYDSKSMYMLAEHHGRILPYHLTRQNHLPTPLLFEKSTNSLTSVKDHLIVSTSSLTSPNDVYLIYHNTTETDSDKKTSRVTQITHFGVDVEKKLAGMEGEEFWFEGTEGNMVMGWAVKPRGWKEGEKKVWPMVSLEQMTSLITSGGPQGAWEDAWSTRWNPSLFASLGYFVIAINPTGSTGYGQEFTDRIQNSWGDRPFKDLVAGYFFALDKYPEIDPERTAALGASFGGYMINWINGHNVFGFKALVYHDGILDTTDMYFSTEEIWFPNQNAYERYNPLNHVSEWATPQLVIQGGQDFRLPESQAIGTFTALQVQGVPSRFLYFPDENHWVTKASNSRKWHYEVLRWLDEWVGHGRKASEFIIQ